MPKVKEEFKFYSLMEERARLFKREEKPATLKVPCTAEETKRELTQLSQILKSLSRELKEARSVLDKKQRQFTLFANYKYFLEKSLMTPTLVTLKTPKTPKKDEATELLEKLEALTPSQLKKLEDIEL